MLTLPSSYYEMKLNLSGTSCSYLPGPDDIMAIDIAYTIYLRFEDWTSALRIALFLDNVQVSARNHLHLSGIPFVYHVNSLKRGPAAIHINMLSNLIYPWYDSM